MLSDSTDSPLLLLDTVYMETCPTESSMGLTTQEVPASRKFQEISDGIGLNVICSQAREPRLLEQRKVSQSSRLLPSLITFLELWARARTFHLALQWCVYETPVLCRPILSCEAGVGRDADDCSQCSPTFPGWALKFSSSTLSLFTHGLMTTRLVSTSL